MIAPPGNCVRSANKILAAASRDSLSIADDTRTGGAVFRRGKIFGPATRRLLTLRLLRASGQNQRNAKRRPESPGRKLY
jgi:hypothetical protein